MDETALDDVHVSDVVVVQSTSKMMHHVAHIHLARCSPDQISRNFTLSNTVTVISWTAVAPGSVALPPGSAEEGEHVWMDTQSRWTF